MFLKTFQLPSEELRDFPAYLKSNGNIFEDADKRILIEFSLLNVSSNIDLINIDYCILELFDGAEVVLFTTI